MSRPARRWLWALAAAAGATAVLAAGHTSTSAASAATGTIKGRVKLTGPAPGNVVIRMGMDPGCSKANAGKRVVQEVVVTSDDGGLANVFVHLTGSVPHPAPPAAPVVVDQRSCVYTPRVVGAQVGQTLEVKNDDMLLHNVHAMSDKNNAFNVGQPLAGMVYRFTLKDEETMLRLKCDVHRWMTSYVGVVSHPYFAVTGADGSFEIKNVPAGAYTVKTWHERYGELTKSGTVKAGAPATISVAYTGNEAPPTGVQDADAASSRGSMRSRPGGPR